ncbi:MAG: hypothetical protein NZ853_10390 [Leptospiraceae bacterium]|nr:hypothetical protein [Leptospiraceae bacterium]
MCDLYLNQIHCHPLTTRKRGNEDLNPLRSEHQTEKNVPKAFYIYDHQIDKENNEQLQTKIL